MNGFSFLKLLGFLIIWSLPILVSCESASQTPSLEVETHSQYPSSSQTSESLSEKEGPTLIETETVANTRANQQIQTSTFTPTVDTTKASVAPVSPTVLTTTSDISVTNTPYSTPTRKPVDCKDTDVLPNRVSPSTLDVANSHMVVTESFLYLATENLIGLFDISNSYEPIAMGFWSFPQLPEISDLKIDSNLAYVTSGATIQVMNLSPQCQFAPIVSIDMPFEIIQIEIEGDRLYVGGVLDDGKQREIQIFDITVPSEPITLETFVLGQEPTLWSLFEENLYYFLLESNKLFIIDVSDLNIAQPRPISIDLNSDVLASSWIKLINDKLYLLGVRPSGFWIVSGLKDDMPTINYNPEQYILTGVYTVQENHVYLGSLGCEGGEINCNSTAYVLDADSARELTKLAFHQFGDIYHYEEIQENLLYAFTNDLLVVIDISNISKPIIIDQIPLLLQ